MTLRKKAFEKIKGKGENPGNKYFLLFPQHFLPFSKHMSLCGLHLVCPLQMLSI